MPRPLIIRPEQEQEVWFEEGCYILECLNSQADPQTSIAKARVLPGTATVRHFLRATTERYYILEGEGVVEIGEEPPTAVGPGDVVLIPPEVRQRISNAGSGDLVFLCVCTPRFKAENYVSS